MKGAWKELSDAGTTTVLTAVFGFLGYFVFGIVGYALLATLAVALPAFHSMRAQDGDASSQFSAQLIREESKS